MVPLFIGSPDINDKLRFTLNTVAALVEINGKKSVFFNNKKMYFSQIENVGVKKDFFPSLEKTNLKFLP